MSCLDEVKNCFHECTPPVPKNQEELSNNFKKARSEAFHFVHVPYFPPFHRPGWLLRYIVGPHTNALLESFLYDLSAGITVCLTLIPQALSYGTLANLPAINGLYAAIIPSVVYAIFGSSMQLAVGPVAVVSLLVGQLIAANAPLCSYTAGLGTAASPCPKVIDPLPAINTAAQASFSVGVLLMALSFLNFGSLINLIAKPVITGFTCGAAMTIGLSQLKDALGYSVTVPQGGQHGYEYNYEIMKWYIDTWNDTLVLKTGQTYSIRNPYSISIWAGIFFPMMFLTLLKLYLPVSAERRKTYLYHAFSVLVNVMPLIGIVIGANIAWQIKSEHHWVDNSNPVQVANANNVKVVGTVPAGLNIFRVPTFLYPFWSFLGKCVVIALILYMESYSVARRIASKRNELHIMNASQEMFSNGLANLFGTIFTAYPVSGSFSRSSLNYLAGARTPLSKITTVMGVIIALATLTDTFYYIPRAALTAVIYVALFNLLCIEEIWDIFKNSKKDFLVLLTTLVITFVFDTGLGIGVGLALSLLIFLSEFVVSKFYKPDLVAYSTSNNGIAVVKVTSDLNFLTAARVKALTVREQAVPDSNSSRSDYLFHLVSSTFDRWLIPSVKNSPFCKDLMPLAVVVDIDVVLILDFSGLSILKELAEEAREKNVKFVIMNVQPHLLSTLVKYGIENDESNKYVNLSKYLSKSKLPVRPRSDTLPLNPVSVIGGSDNDNDSVENGLIAHSIDRGN